MKLEQMTPEDWDSLAEKAHANAVSKGFYDQTPSDEHIRMLAVCELAEAVEADRKGRRAVADEWIDGCTDDLAFQASFNLHFKDTVEDELADFVIRCLDYVGWKIETGEWCSFLRDPVVYLRFRRWEAGDGITEMAYHATKSMIVYAVSAMECVLSYCQFAGIDIMRHVELKMRYNELRPRLHGKKY